MKRPKIEDYSTTPITAGWDYQKFSKALEAYADDLEGTVNSQEIQLEGQESIIAELKADIKYLKKRYFEATGKEVRIKQALK